VRSTNNEERRLHAHVSEQMLPIPEPELTPDEIVGRAEALRPLLLEEQQETEDRGYYSELLHQEFLRAGFYRCLQPRRFGGYEFDLPTFSRLITAVARGCPSSGWCLCLASGHVMNLASLFSEQAQVQVFGKDGEFRAPSRGIPMGSAVPVGGGYRISGTWDYCSGVPYSTHFIPVVHVPGADPNEEPSLGLAVLPRAQWTMLDDWGDVLGMRGSGSHSIRVDNALVPAHFVVHENLLDVDVTGGTPGYRIHGNPMYAGRTLGFFYVEIVSIVIGAARAALDEYETILRSRTTYAPPIVPRYKHSDFQRPYGLALGMVDAAESTVLHAAEQYMEYCRRGVEGGEPFTPEEDMRLFTSQQHAARLAWEATELLFRTAGTSAARNGSRLQRYYRDLSMARTQFAMQYENMAQVLARLHFGEPRWG
jgi:3-hydroxy-9,10-secoandrosta-1,3,5(10)-triene-9,17-dione monooxygenase